MTPSEIRFRLMRKDGSSRQVLEKGQTVSNSDGTSLYYSVIVDLSRFELIEPLTKQQNPAKTEIVIDWDCSHNQIFVSDTFEKVFGYSLDVTRMRNFFLHGFGIHPDDAERLKRRFDAALEHHESLSEECRLERSDGSYLWCQVHAQAICSVDGEMEEMLATIVSTEVFRGGALQIVDQRRRDAVTGLYQRAYLEEYLSRYLANNFGETNSREQNALLYLGLFNLGLMKNIQDSAVVDEVMRRTSHILRREMGKRTLITKVDNAHFALVLMNVSSKNVIIEHAESLLATLQEGLSVFTASDEGIACMGIVFVDNAMNIRKFTEYVGREFGLMDHDVGRPLQILSHNFQSVDLANDAADVLKMLMPIEREVQATNDKHYTMRVAPYRTTDNSIKGLVITIIDSLSAAMK